MGVIPIVECARCGQPAHSWDPKTSLVYHLDRRLHPCPAWPADAGQTGGDQQ